jgi:hypothetical protein
VTQTTSSTSSPLTVRGPSVSREDEILTPDALEFVADLQREFGARRDELLARRRERRDEIARTHRLDFLSETQEIRDGAWQVAPAPRDLTDRRVEITGPTEPKMAINALNSGAKVWLADLEDANTPHWGNVLGGQLTLHDAVRRQPRNSLAWYGLASAELVRGDLANVGYALGRGVELDPRNRAAPLIVALRNAALSPPSDSATATGTPLVAVVGDGRGSAGGQDGGTGP